MFVKEQAVRQAAERSEAVLRAFSRNSCFMLGSFWVFPSLAVFRSLTFLTSFFLDEALFVRVHRFFGRLAILWRQVHVPPRRVDHQNPVDQDLDLVASHCDLAAG